MPGSLRQTKRSLTDFVVSHTILCPVWATAGSILWNMTSDSEKLQRFVNEQSEAAFSDLVSQHLDMVFSVARRHVAGETALAEDITQQVFADLARKAHTLTTRRSLANWLYQRTRFISLNAIRAEKRRKAREQEAAQMQENPQEEESVWNRIEPFLVDALAGLDDPDREALLLRFFCKKSHQEIGNEIGATEDAARKRVGRALDKLRILLEQRGIAAPLATLIGGLSANAVWAAPPNLLSAVIAGIPVTTSAIATNAGTISIMTTKAKILVSTALIIGVTTPVLIQQSSVNRLAHEHEIFTAAQSEEIAKLKNENTRLAGLQAELNRREGEHRELLQLRNEVSSLRAENQSLKSQRPKQQQPDQQSSVTGLTESDPSNVPPEWKAAARWRNMRFSGKPLSAEEIEWLKAAKPYFENLEHEPGQFAEFQTSLIHEALPAIDSDKLGQIQQIIQETYQKAAEQNLDLPSKPLNDSEEWVARRHQLDREGTRQVQGILSEEERAIFDSRFLGVMGVDLGTGVDNSNYPAGFLGSPPPASGVNSQPQP